MGGTGAPEPRGPVGQGTDRRTGTAMPLPSGPLLFAVLAFIAGGAFQVLEGTTALTRGDFFVVTRSYPYQINVTAWGWIHVISGIVLIAVSLWLVRGSVTARFAAMALAVVSAVVHFMFIPYQPIWSVLVIVVDGAVIWALTGRKSERI